MKKPVLFIQGAGEGAYEEDRKLADSLQDALGAEYQVFVSEDAQRGESGRRCLDGSDCKRTRLV